VDAKTKTLLDDYRKKKKARENGEQPAEKDKDKDKEEGEEKSEKEDGEESSAEKDDEEDDQDEDSQREDRVAQAGLEAIMREYAFELAKEPPAPKQGTFIGRKKCRTNNLLVGSIINVFFSNIVHD
jgi:RNA-binding protein 25